MAIYDISEYQGNIDFAKLKNSADGVIARNQAGSTHKDAKYDEYTAEMVAHSIPFGTYSFFKGVSVNDSIQEAKDSLLRMHKDSKFFVLDIEEVSMNDLVAGGQAYVDYMRQNGVQKIGLYSGESFYNEHNLANIKGIDFVWIAKYGSDDGLPHTKPSIVCDLWQYTSKAKVDGVPDNTIDVSQLCGNKELNYFFGEKVEVQAAPVVAPPKPAPAPAPVGNVYVVKAGDNLTKIANLYGVTVQEIAEYNHIPNPNNIQINERIVIPSHSAPQVNVAKPVYHKVVSGDTVSFLAMKFGSRVKDIQIWNKLDAKCTIYVGQTIRVK